MNLPEFMREFSRLEHHFRLNDDDRNDIKKDWFKALSHHHVDVFSNAVDTVMREATDTFWPALGKITAVIRARMSKYEQTRRECPTCNGTTWITALPWISNGHLYEGMQRCPDCGVPPPAYTPPSNRQELTATEYAHYLQGDFPHPEIPIARSQSVVKQALDMIRTVKTMKPLAQDVSIEKALASREPGEEG